MNHNTTIHELTNWKWEELITGSRIKASKIHRVMCRVKERHYDYCLKSVSR